MTSATPTLATSVRKIRDRYFEIVPDKKLMPGEYAFAIQQAGVTSMGGEFAILDGHIGFRIQQWS